MGFSSSKKIKNEAHIKGEPESLNKSQMNKIFEQMSKSICKIDNSDLNLTGTGFLCLIPFPNKFHNLPVLITCNHVFNDLQQGNEIKLIFENKNIKLKLDESRMLYTNEEYDITIIELKENEFKEDDYLNIDDMIITKKEKEINEELEDKTIYIIHVPKGKEVKQSINTIKKIKDNYIYHRCETEEGSSGAPILYLHSHQVLGVHRGNYQNEKKNLNIGSLLKLPIEDFNKTFKNNKKSLKINNGKINNISKNDEQKEEEIFNEILLTLKIEKKNINKKIFFLDNAEFIDDETNEIILHDNLKELNEKNLKLYINEKEYKYCNYFTPNEEGIYKIKIIITIKMINCSYMFYECNKIINIDFSNFDTSNTTNMNSMFYGCNSLESLAGISKWNTNNVTDMSYMFSGCDSLESLPDISKWNTNNVNNFKCMFYDCNSLESLPDISKWNTNNVNNFKCMFYDCNSLESLPDISKWNINNATNLSYFFYGCNSIEKLPDISTWNTNKVNDMTSLFSGCDSLESLPDISKWNTNNVNKMTSIFYGCNSL